MISRHAAGRAVRYTAIGAICALTHNAVMILGDRAGINYMAMLFVSFALVTPLGYMLHARFTFREAYAVRDFVRFASGVAVGFPISFALMAMFCSGAGLPVAVATPIVTVILYVWNYASAHRAILRRWQFH
ncbi:MAG: GtrA family protein [Rhodospirillales bacterium]|nr:GtrA family protein [Rhodospirillales bacterium]